MGLRGGAVVCVAVLGMAWILGCAARPPRGDRPPGLMDWRHAALDTEQCAALAARWEAYVDQRPREARAWVEWGHALWCAGEDSLARAGFEHAFALDPADPAAIHAVVTHLMKIGADTCDHELAHARLERAIGTDPAYTPLYYIQCLTALRLGEVAQIAEALRQIHARGELPPPLEDYGYNMLAGLEAHAILLVQGDKDIFPLWYQQMVRGYRNDVRVVSLQLLDAKWYIRDLRDREPRMQIGMSDEEIEGLHAYLTAEGEPIWIRTQMVPRILAANTARPIYLAASLDDLLQLEPHLELEGLVFRHRPQARAALHVNVDATRRNLEEVYRLDSLHAGKTDTTPASVLRDLRRKYAAGYVWIAQHFLDNGASDAALDALEAARRIFPDYPGLLYTQATVLVRKGELLRAADTLEQAIASGDRTTAVHELLATVLLAQKRPAEAEGVYRRGLESNPEDFRAYELLITHLWESGRRAEGIELLERWVAAHPADETAREALRALSATGGR